MPATVHVSARITARKDKIDEVATALCALVAPTRLEPGCISYRLLQDEFRHQEFVTVEEWRSAEDAEAHLYSPHVQAAIERVAPLLDAAPDIRPLSLLL